MPPRRRSRCRARRLRSSVSSQSTALGCLRLQRRTIARPSCSRPKVDESNPTCLCPDGTNTEARGAYEQAGRQRWRALALVIKAKLEAVESGVETFEDAFLSHIVLPGGGTIGRWLKPQLQEAYVGGKMPPLLGAG